MDNPSLLFYLNREVYWVRANPKGEFASRELGIGRDLFLTDEELARRWGSPQTVLLVTESDDVAQWQGKLSLTPAQARPVAQSGTRVLLINRLPGRLGGGWRPPGSVRRTLLLQRRPAVAIHHEQPRKV